MRVQSELLRKLLNQASFASNGDNYEQQFGAMVSESFPNCERFWRVFVIPLTQRIEGYPDQLATGIHFRQDVSPELQDISAAHYSAFMNLVYAHAHAYFQPKGLSWIADFYVHLASACDLAEAVLEKWYLLSLRCRGEETKVLQWLGRDEFFDLVGAWYDERYPGLYDHYLSKGKSPPLRLPSRQNILEEYLGHSETWKEYKRHSQPIREFRNVVVHDVRVGRIVVNGEVFIPKPKAIQRYKTWREVFAVVNNQDQFGRDFVQPGLQTKDDLTRLETVLNQLWEEFLIAEFEQEFYSSERTALRELYGIEFENNSPIARLR